MFDGGGYQKVGDLYIFEGRAPKKPSKKPNRIEEIKILHVNANGISQKNKRLLNAIDHYNANIVTLNETKQKTQKIKGVGAWYSK